MNEKTIIKGKTYTHITLAEIKAHLRINDSYTAEDTQLLTLLTVATSEAEHYIENNIALTQFETTVKDFASDILIIEQGNLHTITSIEVDGVAISEYEVEINEFDFEIHFNTPVAASKLVIKYTAGFDASNRNEVINQAILIRLADRYEVTRSSFHTAGYATNNAFEALLNYYKKLSLY